MPRALLLLGLVVVLAVGGGVAFLLVGGADPAPPEATDHREADTTPRAPRALDLAIDGPPPAPAVDEVLEARLELWREAVGLHEAGHVLDALEIVARIREEAPDFLAVPRRAALVAAMEDAALVLLQEALDAGRLVTARKIAATLVGLVLDPGRLDVVDGKRANADQRLAQARRAAANRLLARARNPAERQTLKRHVTRFGPGESPRKGRGRTPVDRNLDLIAERNKRDRSEALPVPDLDEAEKRRREQLEKLRQRNAVGLLDDIASGLAWLALHQADDGRITESSAKERCKALGHKACVSSGSDRYPVASTALAVIAFLDFRDQDARGLFEPALARGVDWLRSQQKDDGSFHSPRMYSHAIAVMALGQAAASSGRPDLRTAVEKGLAWLAAKPGPAGGYRYRLGQAGDLSVSGWVAQGYEMAGLCEAKVPTGLPEGLRTFWSTVWLGAGRFSYLSGGSERRAIAPVGMLVGLLLEHPSAVGQEAVWRQSLASWRGRPSLYSLYYGVRVLLAMDGRLPKKWNDWVFELAAQQTPKGSAAGSFPSKGWWRIRSPEMTTLTAFSVLTLEHSLYRR